MVLPKIGTRVAILACLQVCALPATVLSAQDSQREAKYMEAALAAAAKYEAAKG